MKSLSSPDLLIPLGAILLGFLAAALFGLITLRHARRRNSKTAAAFARDTTLPLFLLLPVFLARLVQPLLHVEPAIAPKVRHAGTLLLILGFGWLLISLISVLDEYLRERFVSGRVRDERRARRVLTRVGILDRALTILVVVMATAAMLVTFPEGRAIGASILASAGIAALVLGIAARPAAESLITGLRVALTEPFHIDDVGRCREFARRSKVVLPVIRWRGRVTTWRGSSSPLSHDGGRIERPAHPLGALRL